MILNWFCQYGMMVCEKVPKHCQIPIFNGSKPNSMYGISSCVATLSIIWLMKTEKLWFHCWHVRMYFFNKSGRVSRLNLDIVIDRGSRCSTTMGHKVDWVRLKHKQWMRPKWTVPWVFLSGLFMSMPFGGYNWWLEMDCLKQRATPVRSPGRFGCTKAAIANYR